MFHNFKFITNNSILVIARKLREWLTKQSLPLRSPRPLWSLVMTPLLSDSHCERSEAISKRRSPRPSINARHKNVAGQAHKARCLPCRKNVKHIIYKLHEYSPKNRISSAIQNSW